MQSHSADNELLQMFAALKNKKGTTEDKFCINQTNVGKLFIHFCANIKHKACARIETHATRLFSGFKAISKVSVHPLSFFINEIAVPTHSRLPRYRSIK